MEYDESRLYTPGDDIRALDWRVTARTGRTHTKLYRDERDRPVILSVDYRHSMYFGTRTMFKSALAIRLAAVLAWRAYAHGDRVGHQLFAENGLLEAAPELGRSAVLKTLKSLVDGPGSNTGNLEGDPLTLAFERLPRHARPGCLIQILSDFRGLETLNENSITHLTRHASVEFLMIQDPLESWIPLGKHRFSDGQKDYEINVDPRFQADFEKQFSSRVEHIRKLARKFNIRIHTIRTDDPLTSIEAKILK